MFYEVIEQLCISIRIIIFFKHLFMAILAQQKAFNILFITRDKDISEFCFCIYTTKRGWMFAIQISLYFQQQSLVPHWREIYFHSIYPLSCCESLHFPAFIMFI